MAVSTGTHTIAGLRYWGRNGKSGGHICTAVVGDGTKYYAGQWCIPFCRRARWLVGINGTKRLAACAIYVEHGLFCSTYSQQSFDGWTLLSCMSQSFQNVCCMECPCVQDPWTQNAGTRCGKWRAMSSAPQALQESHEPHQSSEVQYQLLRPPCGERTLGWQTATGHEQPGWSC